MNTHTYFKSPEGEKAIMTFYDSMLAQWPVPYETHQIDTGLGPTFVIASGEKTAPPTHAVARLNLQLADVGRGCSRVQPLLSSLRGRHAGRAGQKRPPK